MNYKLNFSLEAVEKNDQALYNHLLESLTILTSRVSFRNVAELRTVALDVVVKISTALSEDQINRGW